MGLIDTDLTSNGIQDFLMEKERDKKSAVENIEEVTIRKVGRKYVATIYGDTFPFASRKEAEECIERYALAQWISAATRTPYQFRYSLDQLRRVKAILSEMPGDDPEVV